MSFGINVSWTFTNPSQGVIFTTPKIQSVMKFDSYSLKMHAPVVENANDATHLYLTEARSIPP
jgi:hypothetical protein